MLSIILILMSTLVMFRIAGFFGSLATFAICLAASFLAPWPVLNVGLGFAISYGIMCVKVMVLDE